MPYVTCPKCALSAYTAARWATADTCPGCDAPLASARRRALPPLPAPRIDAGSSWGAPAAEASWPRAASG